MRVLTNFFFDWIFKILFCNRPLCVSKNLRRPKAARTGAAGSRYVPLPGYPPPSFSSAPAALGASAFSRLLLKAALALAYSDSKTASVF